MTMCTCLVQAGLISPEQRARLQVKLDGLARSNFGSAADIRWIEIAKGSGFTAGRPSTSSFVSLTANAQLDQSARTSMLRELCDFWATEANCSLDEIMAVIADPTPR